MWVAKSAWMEARLSVDPFWSWLWLFLLFSAIFSSGQPLTIQVYRPVCPTDIAEWICVSTCQRWKGEQSLDTTMWKNGLSVLVCGTSKRTTDWGEMSKSPFCCVSFFKRLLLNDWASCTTTDWDLMLNTTSWFITYILMLLHFMRFKLHDFVFQK